MGYLKMRIDDSYINEMAEYFENHGKQLQGMMDSYMDAIRKVTELMYYICDRNTEFFGRLDGLDALYDKGLISEENYTCLMDIHEQVNERSNPPAMLGRIV